jgi:protein TonB
MARKKQRSTIYMVSVGAHLVLGLAIAMIPKDKLREVIGISMSDARKPPPKPAEPPKREDKPRTRPARAGGERRSLANASTATANEAAPVFTDIGIALDANAIGGIPINMAPKPKEKATAPLVEAVKPKILAARAGSDHCTEPLIKARPERLAQPEYTREARAAHIEGRVRLELTVDEQGNVRDVKLLKGLGYGLDDAAVAAAKRIRFRPATLCGKIVSSPFTLAMRFVYSA